MKEGWTYKKLGEICEKGTSNISLNKIEDNEGNYPLYGASGYVKSIDFFHQSKPYIGVVKDGNGVGRVGLYPAMTSLVGTMQYIYPKGGNEIGYLKYLLIGLHLEKFKTGAAIPHIYYKDYSKSLVPVPSLREQQQIVSELDLLSGVIEKQKAQIEELDKLAQSIFYEMFGDPVTNEKGWETDLLKNNVEEMFLGPFGSALKVDSYVQSSEAYCMVYEQKHAIQATLNLENHFINKAKFDTLSRFEVKPGDFIMSCRGTIGKIYRLPENAPKGIIHPSLMKIRIKTDAYIPLYFSDMITKIVANENTNGNCVQMAITAKALGNKYLPLPPLSLQQEFAAKIEAIEAMKAKVRQSLKESEQLFNSRMDYYFN